MSLIGTNEQVGKSKQIKTDYNVVTVGFFIGFVNNKKNLE